MTSEDSEVTESVYEDRRYESTSAWRPFFIVMIDCHDQYIAIFIHDICEYLYSIIISCLFKLKVSYNIDFILIDLILISGCQVCEYVSHKTKI